MAPNHFGLVSTPNGSRASTAYREWATRCALVVLPELAAHPAGESGAAPDPDLAVPAIVAALAGTATRVVTSVIDDAGGHVGVVLSADGVELTQPQLHASARIDAPPSAEDGIQVLVTDWGRLAVIVGDDALSPETFRLAALADADVVAVPFAVAERYDVDLLLLERAAENRLNVVVASRPHSEFGAGAVIGLSGDFTLWGEWEGPFAGVISRPDPIPAAPGLTVGTLRPACAMNRMVSRGTDVVDGRPWRLVRGV